MKVQLSTVPQLRRLLVGIAISAVAYFGFGMLLGEMFANQNEMDAWTSYRDTQCHPSAYRGQGGHPPHPNERVVAVEWQCEGRTLVEYAYRVPWDFVRSHAAVLNDARCAGYSNFFPRLVVPGCRN